MSIKSISSFFPLIDDPANIFYSKLKSIFLSFINITPNVSSVNRYIYRVDVPIQNHYPVHVNFNIRIQSTRTELKQCLSQESPTYVYVGLRLDTKFITNKEITVTGETIPVDENRTIITHLKRGNPFYYVNISSFSEEQSVLIEYDTHKVPTHIYFLIGKVIKDDGVINLESVNVIKGLGKDKPNISFAMLYKPEIGRKWVINQNDWELYSIDSDLREILIDSSTHAFNGGDYLPVQNCPFKDRSLKLTFGKREYNQGQLPCTITVYEQEYYSEHPVNLEVRGYGEYSLYSNYNIKDISLLFSSLSFKNNTKRTLYQEEVCLALSYILGIDIRFFTLSSQSILSPYETTINRQSYYQDEIHTCSKALSNAITSDLMEYFILPRGDLFSLPSYENDYVRIPVLPNCLGYTKQLYLTRYASLNVDLFYSLSSSLHSQDAFPIRPRGTKGKCLYDFILSLPTLGLSCIESFSHSVLGE